MKHFGILCPPGAGHLNPMTTLGYQLQKRGHRVTLFGLPDVESYANAAKLDFFPVGTARFPVGSTRRSQQRLGELNGLAAIFKTIDLFRQGTEVNLQEVPPGCQQIGIEVLLIDQTLLEGSTIAEYLKLPFITVCCALLLNPESTVPPPLTDWNYDPSWSGQIRNQIGTSLLELAGTPIKLLVNEYRKKWNLASIDTTNKLNLWSKKAIISQQPPSFEYPRQELPDYFHFTGPLISSVSRAEISFPWDKLTEKSLIYASLGTIQNKLLWVFSRIASACQDLDVQLIISLGGATEPKELGDLPGSPIVVKAVPQLSLLERASLCITHAGMNTTLESLSNGVPMVAIPITNDQPAVASRIAWTQTGKVISLKNCKVDTLAMAIKEVLSQPKYRQNAMKFKEEIDEVGGITTAANIVGGITTAANIIEAAIN